MVMEYHIPDALLNEKAQQIGQAVFFGYSGNEKIPLALLREFAFINNTTIEFKQQYFPVLEEDWKMFAGELFFYHKDKPWTVQYKGVVSVHCRNPFTLHFAIQDAQLTEKPGMIDHSIQNIISTFISNTGTLIKRVWQTGL